jgi:hypothetical protein
MGVSYPGRFPAYAGILLESKDSQPGDWPKYSLVISLLILESSFMIGLYEIGLLGVSS